MDFLFQTVRGKQENEPTCRDSLAGNTRHSMIAQSETSILIGQVQGVGIACKKMTQPFLGDHRSS